MGKKPLHIEEYIKKQQQEFFFEHEEFLAMKAALPYYLRVLVAIAYYTGMRKKEILDLKWDQINFAEQIIWVLPSKTVDRSRIIFMNAALFNDLKKQKSIREKYHPHCRWVVFGKTGERICDFRQAWRTACLKTSLTGKFFLASEEQP